MQVYDETSSAAAVQWMLVVRQHLENVDAIAFMQGMLTSTCAATKNLLRWMHDTMLGVLDHAPDSPAAADTANNASVLFFVLLRDQLNRVCAEAGIATQPLSIIRNSHVVPFLQDIASNQALLRVALHIAAACQDTAFTWPASMLDPVFGGAEDCYLTWQAPLRVLSAIRDLQQSLLLHRVWQKSSTSLWGAMVQARLASETIRASLPYCTRAPIKPNSLSMLAEFLHSVRSTAHEVATSCVQGVLEAPEASQFSVPLATPGTLLHAVHHVLDWVLDECLDVVFCEGIERMHGAVDGAGQVNAAAAKHLRVRVVYVCHDTLQSCQHQMAAKAYYNDVFLDATNDAIMAMVQTGELVPASQTVPATLKAINTNAAVVVDVVPAPSKGTKRKQPPKGEVDVYTNQKGMRVLAARNMVAQHD